MEPELPAGAWILVTPARGQFPRLGQVVVLEHPLRPGMELVKRVAAVSREPALFWVLGDNRRGSTDSEEFGPITLGRLRGLVRMRLRPGRPRWLTADPRLLVAEPTAWLNWHHMGRHD